MEKSKETKLIGIIASVFLLFIVFSAAFAYFGSFNVDLNNNVAVNINAVSPGNASFVSSATQLNLQVPAANMSQTSANNNVAAASNTAYLDVTLTGAANLLTTCIYDVVFEYDSTSLVYGSSNAQATSGATKEITMEVNGMNGNNHFDTETNFDYANIQSYYDSTNKYYKLVEGATIKSLGTEQSVRWKITGKYYNLDVSQSQLEGKAFAGKIYAVSKGCTSEDGSSVQKGYETILANNRGKTAIEAKTAPDFSTIEEGNAGMYSYTEGTGKTYYFRGAVDNNWVKYGKFKEDQIVYRGFADDTTDTDVWLNRKEGTVNYMDFPTLAECQVGGDTTIKYNHKCKAVTYAHKGDDMYWRIIRIDKDNQIRMIYAGSKAPSESTKVVLAGTDTNMGFTPYNNEDNRAEYVGFQYTVGSQRGTTTNSLIKTYLDNWYTKYFNENISTSRFSQTTFCNDRNTTGTWASTGSDIHYAANTRISANPPVPTFECNSEDSLTNNLGLIAADEIILAGDKIFGDNTSFYLNNDMTYWTSSPLAFGDNQAYLFGYLPGAGLFDASAATPGFGVRGVITLSSDTKLLGSGTYDDVYIVS